MENKINELAEKRFETLLFMHHSQQEKFVYYILAINAACIAFSVNLTKDNVLKIEDIPLGLSILFWGLSFYYGICQLQNREVYISYNIKEYRNSMNGIKNPNSLLRDISISSRKGAKYRKSQNCFLLFGVLSFIAWRIIEMLPIR